MTKKQQEKIIELRAEVEELKKFRVKCNQYYNEIFIKDEKIMRLESGTIGKLRDEIARLNGFKDAKETKKEKNKRIKKGLAELKRIGILNYDKEAK